MNMTETEYRIREIKSARIQGEAFIQTVRALPKTRESALVITKAQEAVMWLGMMLKEMGTPNPYPESYNPENAVVEPTADGLKF